MREGGARRGGAREAKYARALLPVPPTGARGRGRVCGGRVVALQRVGVLNLAGVAHDLETGQELDIARWAAGACHADTRGLVVGCVFRPILLERVLGCGLVGEAGLLVAAENHRPAP